MKWKRCLIVFMVIGGLIKPVFASDGLVLRAIFPNPVGSDMNEWILVENESSQSFNSGAWKIKDTVGSVQTATLGAVFAPGERRFFSASQSGIVLNNTGDSIQLLNGSDVVVQSKSYGSLAEGMVWLWDNEEWLGILEADFWGRFASGAWQIASTLEVLDELEAENEVQQPEEERISQENASETASPTLSSVQKRRTSPLLTYEKPPIKEEQARPNIQLPDYDFAAETKQFVDWKRQALAGSLTLALGGFWWVLLTYQCVWNWWRDW